MQSDSTSFDLAAVKSTIAGTHFAGYIHHLASTPSTNDLALVAAQSGEPTGVWIADEQTAGRGRGGHTWHSTPGDGLYMTALVSPRVPMQSALSLSLRVAIAVQSAIASIYGFRAPDQVDIRWPNDIMLSRRGQRQRKCGGILIDTASHPAQPLAPAMLRYALIGIGINLNHLEFPPELDPIATSVRRELLGHPLLHREPLAAAILREVDEEIRLMIRSWRGTNSQRDRNMNDFSTWLEGKRVRVEARDGDPGYTGTTAGLNPSGFLLVAGDDGQIHTVLSGGLREP